MTYAKLLDDFPEHQKVVALSDGAFRLYVTALCYSSRNATNGVVSAAMLPRLRGSQRRVAELVVARLWEPQGDGWLVHDYLKHQRSKDQIEVSKAKAAERWQRYQRSKNGVANGVATPLHSRTESREQRAESLDSSDSDSRARGRAEVCYRHAYRGVKDLPVSPDMKAKLALLDTDHPVECIEASFAKADGKRDPWEYVKTIFASCAEEGHNPRGQHGSQRRAEAGGRAGARGGRGGRTQPAQSGAGAEPDPW
jgi:hypothetical protein